MGKVVIKRDNNPRGPFIETVSLAAWRSEYDKEGRADLFIDVSFGTGRVGGESDSPVRFQLALRQAEVHINEDLAHVLRILPESVVRTGPAATVLTTTLTSGRETNGGVDLKASGVGVGAEIIAGGKMHASSQTESKTVQTVGRLTVEHKKTPNGWMYEIKPLGKASLIGVPWSVGEPRLTLKDGNHKGWTEPPEPRIELRCRREDLEITNIQFRGKKPTLFGQLPRARQAAVEQYIKSQLTALGFQIGDIADPYTVLILADVSPEVMELKGTRG